MVRDRWPSPFVGGVLIGVLAAAALAGVGSARGQGTDGSRSYGKQPARSPVVYPPERIRIRVNHSHPAHRELRCGRCHRGASGSDEAADRLMPAEDTCRPCHTQRIDREPRSKEKCGFCHIGFGESGSNVVPASETPAPRLTFSHARHVRNVEMKCEDCHRGVRKVERATREHLPTMKSCFRCHGGARPTATTACESCHPARADGKLKTRFPNGWLNPPRWLHGMHHGRDWLVRHRWVAADRGDDCASCHRESECKRCHDGRVRPQRVHPNDYLTIHGQMAGRNQPECTSCHNLQTFCAECHVRLGISQRMSAPRVRTGERFHPPSDVWVRGPSLHAREAQRSMQTCASCHAERDCVQCHGSSRFGRGVSPHPPGFAGRCARALDRNPRACRTCHEDVRALSRRCR